MDPVLHDVISHAIRVLLLIATPIVFFVALAGTLIGALQTATSVQDSSLRYGVRLLAFVLVLYFLAPLFVGHVIALAERSYGPLS